MKEFTIPKIYLGNISLEDAFNKVFNPDTMKKIHGENMTITNWNNKNERTFKFNIDIPYVPKEIKMFFCGNNIKITTKQYRINNDNNIQVKNKTKLHILGAELVSVKPLFTIFNDNNNHACLSVNIEHHARFPPPLNSIIEGFMAETSKKSFKKFVDVINEN